MKGRDERARASAIAACRAAFARAKSDDERAAAALDEVDVLLEDAWARTVANSAFSPGILGAMVKTGRLAFDQLRECLAADPRWSQSASMVIKALSDEEVEALDSAMAPAEQRALRQAMLWAGRDPRGEPDWAEMIRVGWTTLSVMLSPAQLARLAAATVEDALNTPDPDAFLLGESLSMLCALSPEDPRRAALAPTLERAERTLDAQRDEGQRAVDLRVQAMHLARAYVALGEIEQALAVADRVEALAAPDDFDDGTQLAVREALREVSSSLTAERRCAIDRRLRETLSERSTLDDWVYVRKCGVGDDEDFLRRFAAVLDAAIEGCASAPDDRRGWLMPTLTSDPWATPPERLDELAERLAKATPRAAPGVEWTNAHIALATRGSAVAQALIERTARQRSIRWWDTMSAAIELPEGALGVVIDGAMAEHRARWPVATGDALRWISADVSNSCASIIEALVGQAPIEQQAQRALGALGRMVERGARWLRDGGARDVEADRIAARIARGEFAASPVFDRVWWELGEAAQRQAWLARPTRADRVGALVNARVFETLGGESARGAYVDRVERWLAQCAKRLGIER